MAGRIIEIKDQDSAPTPAEEADELCINCGHCVAVCSHGALSHASMTPDQCAPVRKEWHFDSNQVEHFLRSRRSICTYKDKPVGRELIRKLIDIARFAPSGHNVQPVRWRAIYDNDEVRRLAGLDIDWMRHMLKEQQAFAHGLHMDKKRSETLLQHASSL